MLPVGDQQARSQSHRQSQNHRREQAQMPWGRIRPSFQRGQAWGIADSATECQCGAESVPLQPLHGPRAISPAVHGGN